ncbi:MAG: hypothetical protein ACTSWJ_11610 [Candidatus Heimdallarchaeaceae archaeon]
MNVLTEFRNLIQKIAGNSITLKLDMSTKILNNPIIEHIKIFPKLEWQDIYKFILQGSCGWTHLLSNRNKEKVVQYLNEELNNASNPRQDERLFYILNNETSICRINLRVWKSENLGKLHDLWNLMIKAEESTPKTTKIFKNNWQELVNLNENGYIVTSEREEYLVQQWMKVVVKLTEEFENSSDMPLLHHSENYRINYFPSYRLVNENDLIAFVEKRTSPNKEMEK